MLELSTTDHLPEVNDEHFLHQQVAQILYVIQQTNLSWDLEC